MGFPQVPPRFLRDDIPFSCAVLSLELDNFDDNALEWFKSFREAKPGSPLFQKAVMPVLDLVWAFEEMLSTNTLPQVCVTVCVCVPFFSAPKCAPHFQLGPSQILWIVGPTALSEHATNHPADGEWLTSSLVAALANPQYSAVYAKTAFILNYDEGGQFYDHLWTPTPPISPEDGKSTVPT